MVEQNKEFSIFMYKYMDKMNCGSVGKTASEFGVSRQQFYKWLNGGVPYSKLKSICTVISKCTNTPKSIITEEVVVIIRAILNK
jgi:hypothetical protein